MVVLNKIYTRTGDGGNTALGDGARVVKFCGRVKAYGTVDELNSAVGLARIEASGELDQHLAIIQNDLFDLGADLCRPESEKDKTAAHPPLRATESQTLRLEAEIDAMNDQLEPLKSFVLPGGSRLAAHLHHCRTVARRAERLTVELSKKEVINRHVLTYLNRLSDWLFVAARCANTNGADDVLWVPGAHQE